MVFLRNTRAEFIKTKRTSIGWLIVLGAAFMPVINSLILLNRADFFIPKLAPSPWTVFIHMCWKNTAAILLPVLSILVNNAMAQIEYKSQGWKQVYALPRRYTDIYLSKLVVVFGYLLLFMLFFDVFLLVAGYATGSLNKAYPFAAYPVPWERLLVLNARIGLGILTMTVIQFWLSLRFGNYIIPLATGLAFLVAGLILMDWEKIIYFPYVYPVFLLFADAPDRAWSFVPITVSAAISFGVFTVLGCLDIYFRKDKG